jgi:hypothetical protein
MSQTSHRHHRDLEVIGSIATKSALEGLVVDPQHAFRISARPQWTSDLAPPGVERTEPCGLSGLRGVGSPGRLLFNRPYHSCRASN